MKTTNIIFLFGLLLINGCFAQNKSDYDESKHNLMLEEYSNSMMKKDLNRIIIVSRQLVDEFPDDANGYYGCSFYWKEINNYDSSIFYLKEAVKYLPSFEYYLEIADLYQIKGEDSLELAAINDAVNLETYQPQRYIDMQYESGVIQTRDTLIYNSTRQDLALSRRLNWYTSRGKYNEAIDDINRMIEFNPSHTSFSARGNLYLKMNDFSKALADYNMAVEGDDSNIQNLVLRAYCVGKTGDLDTSISLFDEIINNNENIGFIYLYRGKLYLDSGYRSEGCKDLKMAINLGIEVNDFESRCN